MATLEEARSSAARLLRDAQGRVDLKSMDRATLERWFAEELGETPGRARRVYKALWQQGARSIEDLPGVAKEVREKLAGRAYVHTLEPELILRSNDGTVKYLWRLEDGSRIESVLIPDEDRLTLCMSSQVGCAMACTFCLTGDLGLKRHLKPSEIAGQPLQVLEDIAEHGVKGFEGRRITNLVFMGMGEPLHNLENLLTALRNCLEDDALGFSHRRVTVSTVGLVPKMAELAAALPVNLAVSLNATSEEQRRKIMPITRKYSLEELLQACREFPLPRTKRITFEYVMLAGFNDSLEDAARLFALLQGIRAKVNLIPYNENPDRDLRRPADADVKAFQHYLVSRGMNCTVRTTRGIDISAACGQLGKAKEQVAEKGWVAEYPSDYALPS
jgi:23S rRNA (adenine2503-C2)-methyltransferase